MIFKTIDADATNLTKKMGLLGKSFNDIKKDYSNGLGITKSLFSTSISESDWKSLQKFNSAIEVTNDGLTKSQRITKAWNENMTGCSIAAKRMGNDLVTGKKKISDVSSAMKTATASTKALEIAMNVFANVGFMLAITAVTKVISELAQAQSNAVETAKEATSAYNDELSSIKDYKEKISELNEELNSGNLSYEETKTKRSELMSIQDELIEKFGTEKSAIESVTEAIGGQVDALDDLNEKSYRDWIAKADDETIWTKLLPWGKSGLDQAIDYMETKQTVSFNDMQNANLSDELQEIQKEIDETIQSKYNLDKTFAMFNVTGTPDDIKKQLDNILQDYMDVSKEIFEREKIPSNLWEEYRKETVESINDIKNQFDEGLEKHQETYKTYIEGMIKYDSEYSDEYATILRKRAELEEAENSGDAEKIQKAKQEFMDAIASGITASESDENIKKYFESLYPELQAEFANWKFEIAINANTDNLKDEAEEIGKQYSATDLLDMVNTEGVQEGEEAFNKLIDKAIEYGVCTDNSSEEVQKLIDLLVELGIVQGNINSDVQHETQTSFEIPDAETLKQQISDLNSAIDSIQSVYDTLNSAVEEYNSNGGQLSIDTIQSLLSLSDEYLACLQVENGQLSLNADAMAQLAQAKLDDAQATAVTQAMTELDTIAKGENSSANSAYISGNAALMSSLAQLSGSYEGVAKAAMTAAQAQRMSALISDAAGKDKTATENVMKGLDTKLKLIQTTKASINAGNFGKVAGKSSSSSKGSGSGKSASDTAKEEIEAYMEYLEKALEGGRITYSDYVRDVTLKLDDMYHNGRITAKEYFDYVEKRLNQQLEVYKSVLSAVTDLLEDEAQKWQDKIDALNDENDLLEKQKDDYDSILSAVDQVYQDEIDRLNEQKDLLQDKIDAINDENDALELQRKKQEALIALDKARQQRNVKIYTEDRGYFYSIDQDAYKDAQQNLQDIKNEEVIKKLEDEQDALDDSIELLEKYRDLWNDIADAYKKKTNEALAVALWGENYEKLILQNRTQDIEAFKDKYLEIQSKIDDNKSLIDSYQEKVDYYNKLKDQWNEISSAYEKEQQRMYAAQILGANWEKDVLDGRLDVLSQFRDQYLEIQRQMTQAALDGARARNDAAASGGTGGSGGSSGGGGGSTPIQNQQAYHVLHLVGGYSTSGEASSKISSFNGKGVYKYKDGKWYVYKEEDYSNLSFGSKSEADDYIKKHLSPAGKFLVKYYHNGLENGLVDFSKKDSNFDLVQKYGLKKYEVPAILKQGEAVMNQEQIKNLGEALRAIPTAATLYTTPDYTKMLSSLKTNNTPVMVTQSVNITLPNVTNNSGYENLTRELNRLKLDAYQFANRRN